MRILILGGFGYIGSTLSRYLLDHTDHKITVVDLLKFDINPGYFYDVLKNPRAEYVRGDIADMHLTYKLVQNHDLVINMVALTLPTSAKEPGDAMFINHIMAEIVGDCCKKLGKRMIFMSTCSNYGKSEERVGEQTELFPVSIYAISKVNAEKYLLDNIPGCTILRCATAYGVSPGRTRWDVILNDFVRSAVNTSKIEVFQPKSHRPICHVRDISKAISLVIGGPEDRSGVFNVGSNEQNYTKEDLASIVARHTGAEVTQIQHDDTRDYTVDFTLISREFGFKTEHDPDGTVPALVEELEKNKGNPGP